MTVKSGSAWAGLFVTLDATGAKAASTDAAGTLYIDGTADAASVTITGSNPYKWAVTLPALTAGQRVDMYITGTIGTVATAGIVASAQADTSLLSDVKTDTAAILADTGTDGVKVASLATDSITADALKADAVTKIQNGLALEATLTAIKGAGWTDETLAAIKAAIDAIDVSALATAANLAALDAKVDTVDDFLDTEVAAILADTNELQTDLTNGGRLDLLIDAIKAKTDNLPADPAVDSDIDTAIAAVKSVVDAIKTETDGHPTAAEVWSYGTRTLTNSTTGAVTPAEGDTLEVTKDATIIINFTGLGDISAYDDDTTDEEDKVWFTAKANLDDPDSSAVIQIHTLYPAGTTPPDTLDYINGAAATATEGTFQFTDLVAGDATLTLAAAAAADLPVYAVSPLYWDIKILDYSAGTVSVLASGEMYIYGTPTKSIA